MTNRLVDSGRVLSGDYNNQNQNSCYYFSLYIVCFNTVLYQWFMMKDAQITTKTCLSPIMDEIA